MVGGYESSRGQKVGVVARGRGTAEGDSEKLDLGIVMTSDMTCWSSCACILDIITGEGRNVRSSGRGAIVYTH